MLRKLFIAPLAVLLAIGLVACGAGNDEDPADVLEQTFEPGKDYSSGVMDINFKLSTEGGQEGALDATLSGPFQSAENAFPQFDLTADVSFEGAGQTIDFTGGLISTGDQAFVNFQDTDYQVGKETFDLFKERFLAAQGQKGRTCGINPADFLTDLSNDGIRDVEGTDTIHVTGKADPAKLVEAIRNSPCAAAFPGVDRLNQLGESIKGADFDIYSGEEDKRLRKLETTVSFEPPMGQPGAGSSYSLSFSLTFGELGEEQTVEAPSNARPLNELLQRYQDDIAGLLGGAGQVPGGGAAPPATPAPPSSGESNEYLDCLQEAEGQEEIQACAESLQ